MRSDQRRTEPSQAVEAVGLLGLFVGVPPVGVVFYFVIGIWSLLTTLVALRQTLQIGVGQAMGTLVLAGAVARLVEVGVAIGLGSVFSQAFGRG